MRDVDEPLDLKFFRETLRMRGFNEQVLQEFQEVVNEYVQDDEVARCVYVHACVCMCGGDVSTPDTHAACP